jgi:hypothetical protein
MKICSLLLISCLAMTIGIGTLHAQAAQKEPLLPVTGDVQTDLVSRYYVSTAQMTHLSEFQQVDVMPAASHKSPLLAGALSMVIPGLGEYYVKDFFSSGSFEDYWRGLLFTSIEAGLWYAYSTYQSRGDSKTTEFEAYADRYFSVVRYVTWIGRNLGALQIGVNDTVGVITDWSGLKQPWESVDWGKLNQMERAIQQHTGNGFSHSLPLRPEQQYYELIGKYCQFISGWEDNPNPLPSDVIAQKVSRMFADYSTMRGIANDNYYIATTYLRIILLNHILSGVDAAWMAVAHNHSLKTEAQLLPVARGIGVVELVPTAKISIEF